MTLGEYINYYMMSNNISMRQFARNADISHSYISYIISGKTPRGTKPVLTIDKYVKIANAMGMTVNELFDKVDTDIAWGKHGAVYDEIYDSLSNENNDLIALFDSLNEDGRKKLLEYADDLVSSGKYKKDSIAAS